MDQLEQKRTVLEFVKSQQFGVLSTVDALTGNPEAAWVGVSEKDGLEIIFGTLASSRKYANLQRNNNVAVVIGAGRCALQYEGMAGKLEGDSLAEAKRIHVAKHPLSAKFLEHPDQTYWKIVPRWLRFMDHEKKIEFEIKF